MAYMPAARCRDSLLAEEQCNNRHEQLAIKA
jgi:hypothetical protein